MQADDQLAKRIVSIAWFYHQGETKGKRSYEAWNVYCPEYDLVVASRRRSSWPWWRNGSTEGGEGSPFSYLGGHRPVGPGGSYRCGERYNNLKYRPFFSL